MNPILLITGPTGVGKTSVALRLAERIGAEVFSADSRQVYRELNIGTAKPSREVLKKVRHHFVDELNLNEEFSAGEFGQACAQRISECTTRGNDPIVAGGSTLYLHSLVYGIANIPKVDPEVRTKLIERLNSQGPAKLFKELEKVDPSAARTMDETKSQRIIRALEVFHDTGKTLTSFLTNTKPPSDRQFVSIVLDRDRADLYKRIDSRVDEMIKEGLLEEVSAILETGISPGAQALKSIGYEEVIQHLRGDIPKKECVRLIKRNSRRYAKRQLTWHRRYSKNVWVNVTGQSEQAAANFVYDAFLKHSDRLAAEA